MGPVKKKVKVLGSAVSECAAGGGPTEMPLHEILSNIETIVEKTLQYYDKQESGDFSLLKHYLLENESLKEEIKLLKQQAVIDAEAVVTAQVKLLDNVHLREIIDNLQRDVTSLNDEKLKIEDNAMQEIRLCKKLQKDAELRYSNMENEYTLAITERVAMMQSIRAFDSAETRMQELTGNLEVLLETKKGLELRVVELSDQLTQACNEKESLSTKLFNYEEDHTELRQLESSLLVSTQQRRMLEERVRELELELSSSKKIKEVVDKKFNEVQHTCLKFQEMEMKLDKEIAALRQECSDTRQYSSQLQSECDKLMTECSNKDSEICDLKSQVALLEDECSTVLKQLMQTRDAIVNDSEDGNDSSAEILMLRQSLNIAAEKYDQLKSSMKEILAEKEQQFRELLAKVPPSIENPADRQLDIEAVEVPIIVIQLGYCTTKLYAYNSGDYILEQVYTCPTIIAQPKRPASGGHVELVKNASFQADSMYQYYRENGYFIGNDAEFCLLQHPDPALRGLINEVYILNRDGHLLNNTTGSSININHVIQLILYILQKGMGVSNLSKFQLVFTTKAIYDSNDFVNLAQILYLHLNSEKVCLLDEHYLSSALLNLNVKSYIVVDIGSYFTTVVPYYEGFILKNSIQQTALGGETCTNIYEKMLHSQQIAYYSATTPFKRNSIARFVKEQSIFIAHDFELSKKEYGELKLEKIAVLGMAKSDEMNLLQSDVDSEAASSTMNKARKSITKSISLCIPESDTTATIHVDLERFYGGEVLFSPALFFGDAEAIASIPALLLSVIESIDQCVREDICSTIFITGGSACIPGMKERISRDITPHMVRLGVEKYSLCIDSNLARLEILSSKIATNQLDKGKVFFSKDYDSQGDEIFL